MTSFRLTLSALLRHRARTVFTVLSVAVAFAVFLVLVTLYHGFSGMVNYGRAQRINVWGDSFGPLPLNYVAKIALVPGVKAVAYEADFFGYFRDRKNSVNVEPASFADYMKVFPELHLTDVQMKGMLNDRQGAIAGAALARKMGWKTGDTVAIQGGPLQKDGSTTWTFHLLGIFRSALPEALLPPLVARYDYVNDGRADRDGKDRVSQVFVIADDARNVAAVSHAIDQRFAHDDPTTMNMPDTLMGSSVVRAFGDGGTILTEIGVAVFFSMLLVAGNTLANSVRERTGEFAMMRALGFGRGYLRSLVLGEALLIVGTGAAIGMALGWILCGWMAPVIDRILPYFVVTWQAVAAAAGLAILFAALTGFVPALRAATLAVGEALREA
ncbi:MAG TPA: ABC transporter permease [Rhizomicrobium sp.]|nr:ABC transporter permease [Rhizomicrobium sp.]